MHKQDGISNHLCEYILLQCCKWQVPDNTGPRQTFILLLCYFWHMASAFWPILVPLSYLHSSQQKIGKEMVTTNLYTSLLPASHRPELSHTAPPHRKRLVFKGSKHTWHCLKYCHDDPSNRGRIHSQDNHISNTFLCIIFNERKRRLTKENLTNSFATDQNWYHQH